MKYKIWIEGREDETLQEMDVPAYKDGSSPTMLKIRDAACKGSHFTWADYKNLRYLRIPTKEDP